MSVFLQPQTDEDRVWSRVAVVLQRYDRLWRTTKRTTAQLFFVVVVLVQQTMKQAERCVAAHSLLSVCVRPQNRSGGGAGGPK